MKRFFVTASLLIALLLTACNLSYAQCSLCKSSAESSLKEGDTQAKGLNMGIMYLLVMPYLLVGGIGYYWYVNHKKQEQQSEEEV
jgi:hypothetical protein